MIKFMEKPKHKKIYRENAFKVESMQGLVKDIFELDRAGCGVTKKTDGCSQPMV
jgi:hypothetical protein